MVSLSARAHRVFRKGGEERQDGISGVSLGLPNPVTRDALITALPQPKPLHSLRATPRQSVCACASLEFFSVSRLFPGQRGTRGLLSTLRAGARLGASAQAPSTYLSIYLYTHTHTHTHTQHTPYTHTHTHTHTHTPLPPHPAAPWPSILAGKNRTGRRTPRNGAIELDDRGRGGRGRERRGFLLRRLPGRVTPPALQPRLGFELPEDLAGSPPSGGGEVASCSLLSGQAQCVLDDPYVSR